MTARKSISRLVPSMSSGMYAGAGRSAADSRRAGAPGTKSGRRMSASVPARRSCPLYRHHVFAEIKPATNKRIDLGFALGEEPFTGRLLDTGGRAKKNRITHKVAPHFACRHRPASQALAPRSLRAGRLAPLAGTKPGPGVRGSAADRPDLTEDSPMRRYYVLAIALLLAIGAAWQAARVQSQQPPAGLPGRGRRSTRPLIPACRRRSTPCRRRAACAPAGGDVRDQPAAADHAGRRAARRQRHGDAHQEREHRRPAGDRDPVAEDQGGPAGHAVAGRSSPTSASPATRKAATAFWPGTSTRSSCTASPSAITAATAFGSINCYEDPRICDCLLTYNKAAGAEPDRLPRHRRRRQPVRGEPGRPALHRQLQPVHDRQQPRRPPAARRRHREHLRLGRQRQHDRGVQRHARSSSTATATASRSRPTSSPTKSAAASTCATPTAARSAPTPSRSTRQTPCASARPAAGSPSPATTSPTATSATARTSGRPATCQRLGLYCAGRARLRSSAMRSPA